MQDSVSFEELSDTFVRIGCVESPAEYHGTLCGTLCVRAPEDINLARLLDVGGDEALILRPDPAAQTELRQLCNEALHALQDEDMGFEPLLPDDEAELGTRVLALASWCEGFLFGLASRPGLDLKKCSEEVREVLRDFTQFTQASLGENEDLELEEGAYVELVEYVRVGAQLVFMEFRARPLPDPSQSRQLH
ncbi:hypothetical protein D0B54_14385 [Solimonas sp. K1W22B-7]|uniref:UPF0149 family protein n=1 Tax=Solimonas sp. K1W22B-7 TaxID=2303331 RepID=UPI000E32E4AF|nr:UPF0149 family protein [Solimonas sp. K1W22B-7]AXQ29790.1 hypothetical protein D0B54_14385 [Solimonas sp. K1W22B-7]